MTSPYKRGNRYSARISIADAAVDWQNLSPELLSQVGVNNWGLPVLAGCEALLERAEAILEAANVGKITGLMNDMYGEGLSSVHIRLDRDSVANWIACVEKRLETEQPKTSPLSDNSTDKLLKLSEVLKRLKMSKSTFNRRRENGLFAEPTHENPNMWPESSVTEYFARRVIEKASETPDVDI